MKTEIIIGTGKPDRGPHAMANIVCIPDDVLTEAKDGEDVSFQGAGVLIDHSDGKRYIAVHTVDGSDVEEVDLKDTKEIKEPNLDEEHSRNSTDALESFMNESKNY